MNKKVKGSGALFLSRKTKRFLLLQKASGKQQGVWGLVGGKLETGESAWQGLQREIEEEIGRLPDIVKSIPLENYVSQDENFNFQTYICIVEDEFLPTLSDEHTSWAWCSFDFFPKPVHQGIKNTTNNKTIKVKIETIFQILDII